MMIVQSYGHDVFYVYTLHATRMLPVISIATDVGPEHVIDEFMSVGSSDPARQ
jgi:hypothetical protein